MKFVARGRQYEYNTTTGHVEQIDAKPYNYDPAYSAIYDSPAYVRGNERLQDLRLGFVHGVHGGEIRTINDIGFGNGAFLRAAVKVLPVCYGFDVTGVPLPEGCKDGAIARSGSKWNEDNFKSEYFEYLVPRLDVNVITFWDVLEHIPLETLETYLKEIEHRTTVCISLPNCDVESKGLEWFEYEYFHRKPDEHLRHFSATSLTKFMGQYKFRPVINASYHEDAVRSRGEKNILTMAFRKTV